MSHKACCLAVLASLLSVAALGAQDSRSPSVSGAPGQMSFSFSAGADALSSSFGSSAYCEVSLARFPIGGLGLWLGAMASGAECYHSSPDVALAALATLHAQLPYNLDAWLGAGPGAILTASRWGFEQGCGLVWMLDSNVGLQVQEQYFKNIGSSSILFCGIGAVLRLK